MLFSALADQTRLKLVKLLCRQREPNALCVSALAGLLGVSQSAVSQHLRVLRAIGLVKGGRRGFHIHYSVDTDAIRRGRQLILAALNTEDGVQEDSCQARCSDRREQDVSPE